MGQESPHRSANWEAKERREKHMKMKNNWMELMSGPQLLRIRRRGWYSWRDVVKDAFAKINWKDYIIFLYKYIFIFPYIPLGKCMKKLNNNEIDSLFQQLKVLNASKRGKLVPSQVSSSFLPNQARMGTSQLGTTSSVFASSLIAHSVAGSLLFSQLMHAHEFGGRRGTVCTRRHLSVPGKGSF